MADGAAGDKQPMWSARDWPDGRATTLTLRAKYLNYDHCDELKSALRDAVARRLDAGRRLFVLDLAPVHVVDSSGVGLMIGLQNQVQDGGATLCLCGITEFLQRIFKMMHLDRYFRVVADEADAARQLASPAA